MPHKSEQVKTAILQATSQIVSAYLSKTACSKAEAAEITRHIGAALTELATGNQKDAEA